MKFYKYNQYYYSHYYHDKIIINKLDCVYMHIYDFYFYKHGKMHNFKNAAYISHDGYKQFWLNDKFYGNYSKNFTKKSWRRFVKMQIFL